MSSQNKTSNHQLPGTNFKPEIDWRDLIKKPSKLFGYSYFYFLATVTILGLLYIWNLNAIGRNIITSAIVKDSSAMVQDIPLQSPRVIPPIDVMKVGISSRELVDKGRELYKNNCAVCHGESGKGDGASAMTLNPKPRNFHSASGWKNGVKVTQIYQTLQEGISGTSMASYNYMSPEERFSLTHYIRTWLENPAKDTPEELKQLDVKYELSKGMNVAGQIPIKKAASIIVNESKLQIAELIKAKKMLQNSSTEGAAILKRVTNNEERVLITLIQNKKLLRNLNEFIGVVTANPLQIGFKASVANLSVKEWTEMHGFVIALAGKESL